MQKQYTLSGLDCPDCAAKLERSLRGVRGVQSASINFLNRTLSMKTDDQAKDSDILSVLREWEVSPEAVKASRAPFWRTLSEGKALLIRLGLSGALFALGFLPGIPEAARLTLNILAYLLAGGDVLFSAVRNVTRGHMLDENFLMAVASLGAIAIHEVPEAVAVMLFYQVGEYFQSMAVGRSRKSIAALMDVRPDTTTLLVGTAWREVSPEEVSPGDIVLVRPGQRVPLDGEVRSGDSELDTRALTGEARPRDVHPGAAVLAGVINLTGAIEVRVTKKAGDSTVAKILELVENSGAAKAPAEKFITRFARVYTPLVIALAALLVLIPPLFLHGDWSEWINRGLVFLVVSCPCALVISVPLSFFGGIGGASKLGILFKGGNYMDALAAADTIVFDKTGTLTSGNLRVSGVYPQKGFENLLDIAADVERLSTHPLARAICEAGGGKPAPLTGVEELAGFGVSAMRDGKRVFAGNTRLMQRAGLTVSPSGSTAVYLAVDGVYAGRIEFEDDLKKDGKHALRELKALGVRKTVMLSGDRAGAAEAVARELGLDEVHAELLPADKVQLVKKLEHSLPSRRTLCYVGDGLNDAPVLAHADVGVAMGGAGVDAAIEAADVVIMSDELSKLPLAIRIARRTRRIVVENIVFALGLKAVILALGAMGLAGIWLAVFADVGVAMLAVLNAMRAMKTSHLR